MSAPTVSSGPYARAERIRNHRLARRQYGRSLRARRQATTGWPEGSTVGPYARAERILVPESVGPVAGGAEGPEAWVALEPPGERVGVRSAQAGGAVGP